MINMECRMSNFKRRGAEFYNPGRVMFFLIKALILLLIFAGCSSAPKKPAEIVTERTVAANYLNLANQTANRGRYEDALLILVEARRFAVSTDDPQLRIKTSMSRGNILFSLGRQDEAFREWDTASAEGDASGETVLAAFARIYKIRGELVRLANNGSNDNAAVESLKERLSRERNLTAPDLLATAAGYVTLGIAEKQLGRFADAENAAKKALEIHEKNLNLEEAAYDWFIIASIRSVAGNYSASLEALNSSIGFDRRAENGFGLASSWKAMGEVYQKTGMTSESRLAFDRAAEIYRALALNDLADEL